MKYFNVLSPPISSVLITTLLGAILSRTTLYASNCSSSVGQSSASMYRNSDLNSPTPSAPFLSTPSTSAGAPMFAATSVFHPSLDSECLSLNDCCSAIAFASFSPLSRSSFAIAASGW